MSALSDIKREAQPSVLYLIKHKLRVFWIASKTIHFIPILSLCLRKNFQYRCCISRENRGKSFVKNYVCFITYKDSFTAMISFVFCSWIINEFLKYIYRFECLLARSHLAAIDHNHYLHRSQACDHDANGQLLFSRRWSKRAKDRKWLLWKRRRTTVQPSFNTAICQMRLAF